jgi:hypothetical protein
MKASRLLPFLYRSTLTSLAICAALCFTGSPLIADTLTEGSVLIDYSVVSIGTGSSFNINSGPVVGLILIGNGTVATGSGNNQCSTPGTCNNTNGTPLIYNVSGAASGNQLTMGGSNNPRPTIVSVNPSLAVQAEADARALSTAASALAPTQVFSNNIVGNGGINVININGNFSSNSANSPLITGGPNDLFVFNISGNASFGNASIPTLVGVNPDQILWNLTASSGNCLSTSGGSAMQFGTFLAVNGCNFQFSNLGLTGQLINGGGNIQLVSGSSINAFAPFIETPEIIPEPGSLALFGSGLFGIAAAMRRKFRRH